MRAALLICGEYREFKMAQKTWDFLKDIECDIFVSTWNKSKQVNKNLNIDIEEDITLKDITEYFPSATVSILDEKDYINDFTGESVYDTNIKKMIFHWKNSYELMKQTKKEYDIIILTRPDNFIKYDSHGSKLFNNNKKRTLYGVKYITIRGIDMTKLKYDENTSDYTYFVDDTFVMGNWYEMNNFLQNLNSNFTKSIHNELSKYILSLNYFVDVVDNLNVIQFRPNSRFRENFNYEEISIDHQIWNVNYRL